MSKTCGKCGFVNSMDSEFLSEAECPKCGVIYKKLMSKKGAEAVKGKIGRKALSQWAFVILAPLALVSYVLGELEPPKPIVTSHSASIRGCAPSVPASYAAEHGCEKSKIREFSEREYPNDVDMQKYVYQKQKTANNYMSSVSDSDVKGIAINEYPNDIAMQKYVYDKQKSAKRYMSSVIDGEIKRIAVSEYSTDYSMQKYIYEKQFSAKRYMKSVDHYTAKNKAQREYPNDYSMQRYVYDKEVY